MKEILIRNLSLYSNEAIKIGGLNDADKLIIFITDYLLIKNNQLL